MEDTDDHLIRAISRSHNLRVVAAVTTQLCREGAERHKLSPAAACALGRGLTGGALLATLAKGNERVTIQMTGSGPLGSITVDANADGDVRGYVRNPRIDVSANSRDLHQALGRDGVVNVVRDLGMRELFQGQVSLTTGEIDEDIEAYLRTSEQVPSALGCEVLVDDEGVIVAAAGLLVQAMPDGDTNLVRELQHLLRTGTLAELLAEGPPTAEAVAQYVCSKVLPELEIIDEARALRFQCRCSPEKIVDMLKLLGKTELDEMIAEDHPAEITCDFCGEHYSFEGSELERIRAELAGPRQSN